MIRTFFNVCKHRIKLVYEFNFYISRWFLRTNSNINNMVLIQLSLFRTNNIFI